MISCDRKSSSTIKIMFAHAIVRLPSSSIKEGISSAGLGKPDYELALKQHSEYTEFLTKLGLNVEILPSEESFPDSTFIEDVALCTKSVAVITNPGAKSRNGETEGMIQVLSAYFNTIEKIIHPGTVEGGDIMMVNDHFYIGLSGRTNIEGADQMIKILKNHGFSGSKVRLNKMLHLKSGVSYLENNIMLVCGEFIDNNVFKKFKRIVIDEDDCYATNSLWINGKVLVPAGFPKTMVKIEEAGYETIPVNVSEFRKVDGGLSCLSLRF
jgi:dimethylargininase